LRHWVDLFGTRGVRMVFNGHEHNFQYIAPGTRTRGVGYLVTGAGGKLRGRDIRRRMEKAGVVAWSPRNHFLLVEIDDRSMTVTPLGDQPFHAVDPQGRTVELPIRVQ